MLQGNHANFDNSGLISAHRTGNAIGVLVDHANDGTATFTNTGRITGSSGVNLQLSAGIQFFNHGVVQSEINAFRLSGRSVHLVNVGRIEGEVHAFDFAQQVDNSGALTSNVLLGFVHVVQVGSGSGSVSGVVLGEDGNDRVTGGSGIDRLYGGNGNNRLNGGGDDVLAVGDGDNRLSGGDGDDILTVGVGNPILTGGTGNDRMTGGLCANAFRFGSGNGKGGDDKNIAFGFVSGHDAIDLSALGLTDLASMVAEGDVTTRNLLPIIHLRDAMGGAIWLYQTDIATLDVGDFLF